MTWFPDCRTHEFYNEKYLNETDKEFVAGFDWALKTIVHLIEENLDVDYSDIEDAISKETKEKLVETVKSWMECERDELITSMIDGMSEEEYDRIKEIVDGQAKETDG